MGSEVLVPIQHESDIVSARRQGRSMAEGLGFRGSELTVIATAISEVARNIVNYAKHGQITLQIIDDGRRKGLGIVASDRGPGIPDLKLAMQDGYTTGNGLGLGLPGARRMMDSFEIQSEPGKGTVITMKKWPR